MNLVKEASLIEDALNSYRKWLDEIPDEQFEETPPQGGWSYAEVYSHILSTSLGITTAIERCINKTCEPSKKGVSIIGMMMLGFASFPPFKVKSPVDNLFPVTKITKEEARNMLIKLRRQMESLKPNVHKALPQYRFSHPRMGMLNAQQWFKFIRIHTLHHLKQLEGIRKSFSKSVAA